MPLVRAGVTGGPPRGGRAKIENSSRRYPRKFGLKQFLAVRRSWRGSGVACFWATSFGKNLSAAAARHHLVWPRTTRKGRPHDAANQPASGVAYRPDVG